MTEWQQAAAEPVSVIGRGFLQSVISSVRMDLCVGEKYTPPQTKQKRNLGSVWLWRKM